MLLSEYKRSLFMSGLNCPNSEIDVKEGESAIKAVEEYRKTRNKELARIGAGEIWDTRLKPMKTNESLYVKSYSVLSGKRSR